MTERRDRKELEDGVTSYLAAIRRAAAAADPEADFCEAFSLAMDFAKKGDLSARVESWFYFKLARQAQRDGTDLADAIKAAAADFA